MKKLRRFMATTVLCLSTLSVGAPINRLDIYDAADNHLLFVTFEYNGAGVCTGRSVFAGDSTFMYKTTIQAEASGSKENSVDYLDNPMYTSTVKNTGTGSAEFSTVDQFGLSQFGAALTHSQSEANLFSINQGSTTVCKEKYEYDSTGNLSRIVLLGKNNELLWYAKAGPTVGIIKTAPVKAPFNSLVINSNRGVIKFQCVMAAERVVTAELITPSGRRVAFLVNKKLTPGSYTFTTGSEGLTASGTYIVKVAMNGVTVLTRKAIVQK
jgi:hypothetical protein